MGLRLEAQPPEWRIKHSIGCNITNDRPVRHGSLDQASELPVEVSREDNKR